MSCETRGHALKSHLISLIPERALDIEYTVCPRSLVQFQPLQRLPTKNCKRFLGQTHID